MREILDRLGDVIAGMDTDALVIAAQILTSVTMSVAMVAWFLRLQAGLP